MAEGFDDFEMEDISRKYAEYDNYNEQQLKNEYDSLSKKRYHLLKSDIEPEDSQYVNVKERMDYIEKCKKIR